MQISQRGLDLVKRFEGLELDAYQDAVGVWTIGYGHIVDVSSGERVTPEEAEQLLLNDMKRYEEALNKYVTVPLTQNQFDALCSFAFNLGTAALHQSTLLAKLNAGDYQGAADEFLRWVYAGGRKLSGLERRRKAERDLFLSPDDISMPSDWYDQVDKRL